VQTVPVVTAELAVSKLYYNCTTHSDKQALHNHEIIPKTYHLNDNYDYDA